MWNTLEAWAQAHAVLTGLIVTYFLAPAAAKGLELIEMKLDTTKLSALAAILRSYGFDAETIAKNVKHLVGVDKTPEPLTDYRMALLVRKQNEKAVEKAEKKDEEKS